MVEREPAFASKAGTYDVLVGSDGREIDVYIVRDTPTLCVVEILERGTLLTLRKHVNQTARPAR
jgi:hypothetical protein